MRLDAAKARLSRAVVLAESVLGRRHREERGLALRRAVRGPDHPDVGADLGALGALYLSVGDLDAAEGAYLQALVVLERALGAEHFEVSVLCGNLGLLLSLQGKSAAAEKLYRR